MRTHQNREHAGWVAFFDGLHGDSDQLLSRKEAERYVATLTSALPLDSRARVLEFGCGYGFAAQALAPRVGEVSLWEPAASKEQVARTNLAGCPNARFLDLSNPQALPHDLAVDLILVNSVVQYMRPDEFLAWLPRWRGMLAPGGSVVISDIIPPDHRSWEDTTALLQFSVQEGCVLAAVGNMLGEARAYWRMQRRYPLFQIAREWLSDVGAANGLNVRFLPRNLTHFPKRVTAILSATGE